MSDRSASWDAHYSGPGPTVTEVEPWLDAYDPILALSRGTPIVDLGCGAGHDTGVLLGKGYYVLACDCSSEAIRLIRERCPEARTMVFDMSQGLPLADASARVIVSDLSLHYFDWATTRRIVAEIGRVLDAEGRFLCRVNSTKDLNYGAGQGIESEPNFFEAEGFRKRFFDEAAIRALFSEGWEILSIHEKSMERYGKTKVLWELALRPRPS
jgi:SAM-dependent methyltransferase